MKLQVFSTCVGKEYLDYARISLPSFCKNNPNVKFICFSDHVELKELEKQFNNFRVESFKTWYKPISCLFKTSKDYSKPFHNTDKWHVHQYVSHIYDMAQRFAYADYCLKIDVDEYCVGNIMNDVEDYIDNHKLTHVGEFNDLRFTTFYLVKREHPMMKILNGDPGVGFTLWRKDSKFVETYITNFSQDEQTTILSLRDKLSYHEISNENMHVVFPFTHNPILKKEQLDAAFPGNKIIHVESLEQLKKLEEYYGH